MKKISCINKIFNIIMEKKKQLFIGNRLFELLKIIFIKVEIIRGLVFF